VFASYDRSQQQHPEESPTVPTTVKEFIEAYLSFFAGDVNNALSWDDIRKFEYYESVLCRCLNIHFAHRQRLPPWKEFSPMGACSWGHTELAKHIAHFVISCTRSVTSLSRLVTLRLRVHEIDFQTSSPGWRDSTISNLNVSTDAYICNYHWLSATRS